MSDDNKLMQELEDAKLEAEKSQETSEETVSKTETPDPYLEEAVKNGYNPNYEGVDKKSPEQYVRDGSFFKKINHQKKEISELKDAVRSLTREYHKAEQLGAEKALKELQVQKRAAIEIGDIERVDQIDNDIDQVKEDLRKPEPEVMQEEVEEEVHPVAIKFKERNSTWFGNYDVSQPNNTLSDEQKENVEMTETALVYDQHLGKMISEGRLQATPEQCLQMVQDRMQKYYPHRFENPKKSEPMSVGRPSLGSSTSTKTSDLMSRLTEHQKYMHQVYLSVDPTFGSLEEYAKSLEKIGDLK